MALEEGSVVMLFNSFAFLFLLLPASLLAYFVTARLIGRGTAMITVVASSLFFYAQWKVSDLWVLLVSTLVNYGVGAALRFAAEPGRRKLLLTGGVVSNLAALGYYKYAGFALRTANSWFGLDWHVPTIAMPLAISFFTFTQIAFLVDCARGQASALNLPRYGLFVFFFPHLIAGPIVHHGEIMPQFAEPDVVRWSWPNFSAGLAWLTLGLGKKILLADQCAKWVGPAFEPAAVLGAGDAWAGLLAYTLQLYFDFSGYSDMAIGLSLMFNVRLPDNFESPYKAADIAEFWRRWHMTLSRFLRDYLYIPLGGNRGGELGRYRNLMLTMMLGGLWHGANWTFLLWGTLHGLLLVIHRAWSRLGKPLPVWLARALTFVGVMIGWCLFRSADFAHAGRYLVSLTGIHGFRSGAMDQLTSRVTLGFLAALLVAVNFAPTTKQWIENRKLSVWHGVVLAVIFFACLLVMRDVAAGAGKSEFIYFQF